MRIFSDDHDVNEVIRLLWAPFLDEGSDDGTPIRCDYVVSRDGPGFRLSWLEHEIGPVGPWILLDRLRNTLTTQAFTHSTGIVPLHATFLTHAQGGLLLVGPPFSGKTTLALELLERGWGYGSDDLAPIDVSTGRVQVFPKPLSARNPALWRRLLGRWSPPPWLPEPDKTALVPASVFDRAKRVPIRWVVFPTYDPDAPPEKTELATGLALARCLQNCHGERDAGFFAPLTRLCVGATAMGLRYPSTSVALGQLADAIAHLRGGPGEKANLLRNSLDLEQN